MSTFTVKAFCSWWTIWGDMVNLQAHETLAISSQYWSSSFRISDGHAVNGFVILLAKNPVLSKFLAACIKGRGRRGLFVSRSVLFEPGCIDIWTEDKKKDLAKYMWTGERVGGRAVSSITVKCLSSLTCTNIFLPAPFISLSLFLSSLYLFSSLNVKEEGWIWWGGRA